MGSSERGGERRRRLAGPAFALLFERTSLIHLVRCRRAKPEFKLRDGTASERELAGANVNSTFEGELHVAQALGGFDTRSVRNQPHNPAGLAARALPPLPRRIRLQQGVRSRLAEAGRVTSGVYGGRVQLPRISGVSIWLRNYFKCPLWPCSNEKPPSRHPLVRRGC